MTDHWKRQAAERAVEMVQPDMKLGLGTGSTARHFVDLLAKRVLEGLSVTCVATSEATRLQAEAAGIRIRSLDEVGRLDLTVDGADELDERLRLIKGGGGALLREKIVAAASREMVVIADRSKLVENLGAFPLPVEVVAFGLRTTIERIDVAARTAGAIGRISERLNADGTPFVTDNGNRIVDCAFGRIPGPEVLAALLDGVTGVVEHGLFIGLARRACVAGPDGVRVIEAST